MPETTCTHDRWIIEIEPDVWIHTDDEQCTPAESLPIRYLPIRYVKERAA
jgi:hypothetical protein